MSTPPDSHDESVRQRARKALHRLEDAIKEDVAEAKAMAPLVAEAASVPALVRTRLKRWLPVLAIAAIATLVVASGAYEKLNLETLAEEFQILDAWVASHPVMSRVVFVFAVATIIGTGLPGGLVFTLAGGLLFGVVTGALLAALGDAMGASVLYFAARAFFEGGAKPPALVEKIRAGFQHNPASFTFFIRLVPVFPYGAMSVALAWLGCRYPLFVTASGLGVLPSCFVYSALGAGLAGTIHERREFEFSLLAEPRFAIPLVALAVLALIPVLLGFRRKKL